jgi:hypothetical protein
MLPGELREGVRLAEHLFGIDVEVVLGIGGPVGRQKSRLRRGGMKPGACVRRAHVARQHAGRDVRLPVGARQSRRDETLDGRCQCPHPW